MSGTLTVQEIMNRDIIQALYVELLTKKLSFKELLTEIQNDSIEAAMIGVPDDWADELWDALEGLEYVA